MKSKKPSLLDMESFVQKRSQKTTHQPMSHEEPEQLSPNLTPPPPPPPIPEKVPELKTDKPPEIKPVIEVKVETIPEIKAVQELKVEKIEKAQTNSIDSPDMLQAIKVMFSEFTPPSKDFFKEIIAIVAEQRTEILNLKNEVNKLKVQFDTFNIIADQKFEIKEIRNRLNELKNQIEQLQLGDKKIVIKPPAPKPQVTVDEHYKALILRNIMKMKDDNGFSSLDVAKLFRKEGFAIFPPYEEWDEETVNAMYNMAKKK
ncbi:MAG: hypothetical protein HQK79_15160 [Desulfobacterales bacterium]|nr:hypothetical protein [Desulfobacterales bacterium]